ncbi:unnamed protein product [Parnassius apollo]|uniref:(apollo) hypothetical protein n=1 Tax=Parnassius apollo TaxID=110799 RepID=A0A8S3WEM9_PARAO|nr:unnamed protein product [Parnassius apollo]
MSPTEVGVFELKTIARVVSFLCVDCKSLMAQIPNIMKQLEELTKEVHHLRLRQNMLVTEGAIQELAERTKRANNIIIYDVPESTSDKPLQRQGHDKEECRKIITCVSKKVSCDNVKLFRLGKFQAGAPPRPIKVVMKSKNDAIEILRNKTKLDKPSNIKSDQTAMQREYLKYLRDELENRTNNGEQGSDKIYKEYRKLNNKLTNLRRTARAVYENQLLDLGPKKFYSYIRQQITSKVSTPNILRNSNGQSVTRSKDVAEVFAEHFSNVFEREPLEELPALDPNLRATEVMEDIMFTESKVQAAIKEMNIDSSPGPDEIPVHVLKNCGIDSYLASVMQKSYDKGVLPYLWKTALVTPVYKKGNKLDPANYRPIS